MKGGRVATTFVPVFIDKVLTGSTEEAEEALKKINKIFQIFIELMPVNATTGPALPLLMHHKKPAGNSKFKNNSTKIPKPFLMQVSAAQLTNILKNFPKLIDHDFTVMHDTMERYYQAGWNQARKFYGIHQDLMKRQFAKLVVPLCLENFKKVRNNDAAKTKVLSATWHDFLRLGEALKAADESFNLSEDVSDGKVVY